MYLSVEALSETWYLNRSSHSLSLPARALVCAAAEEHRRREPESCAVAGVDCRRFSLPIGRESTFAVDTRPIGRPNEVGLTNRVALKSTLALVAHSSDVYGESYYNIIIVSRNTCK